MAIISKVPTKYGEEKELYIRVNSVEASNHGKLATALVRGFLNKKAFKEGAHFLWEKEVEFKADVSKSIWNQAYKVLKKQMTDTADA